MAATGGDDQGGRPATQEGVHCVNLSMSLWRDDL